MEVREEIGGKMDERERLEQTCYNPGEMIGFEQVLDELEDS